MTREETRGGGTIYSRLESMYKEREQMYIKPIENPSDVLEEAKKLYNYITRR